MATAVNSPVVVEEDQVFTIGNVDWDQYVTINDTLSERAGLRMIYLDGSLTLVTLTWRHDWYSELIDAIVKAVASGCDVAWDIAGSATFRAEDLKAGVEGDQAYYFGDHAVLMSGPVNIDLTTQPPPDLAIEVEHTNPATKALVIYDRLGVPEVWRYNVKRDVLTFLHRRPEGGYESAPRSHHLPTLGPDDVLGQMRLAGEMGPLSRWVGQLHVWVRETILPRLGQDR